MDVLGLNETFQQQVHGLCKMSSNYRNIKNIIRELIDAGIANSDRASITLEFFQQIGFSREGAKRLERFIQQSTITHWTTRKWIDEYLVGTG